MSLATGGNLLPLLLGIHWRKAAQTRPIGIASIIVGSVGLAAMVTLLLTFGAGLPSGAIERTSVYTIVIWQVAVAIALLRSRRALKATRPPARA